ncbi:hypothetical protein CHLNCDRAFT_139420 [Chlorella variabilis]|uniref:Methyltransferase FkbM domain-containing protein n=1 Tax=Chlorella variabilis TaxID=554065 RepID=E1ZPR9_CHLVA|nr:hypothetical protein CHLNCDRAFT_139420 [Chlorella variabilis]EFN52194.1 hypothetical protein CHLNCDRAFT_139420 [Chlorella variabilis]|eukprot:XP_005844296.1 hypothetical protein CHLNCDRAFT_139420 [Chlorella variabilis]
MQPSDRDWLKRLKTAEQKVFSQNGEDGILLRILANIGWSDRRYYVEFGTESGNECNTRILRDLLGWSGLLMDGSNDNPGINLHKESITPENINDLFAKYDVPEEFDVLSIDVDFDDYWIRKALDRKYRPRVVIMEVNGALPLEDSRTIDPTDSQRWPAPGGKASTRRRRPCPATFYFGSSLRAIRDLNRLLGYTLVAVDAQAVNAFFIRDDILECQGAQPLPIEELYVHNPPAPNVPETNQTRQWLFLDEAGNVVKKEFRPV